MEEIYQSSMVHHVEKRHLTDGQQCHAEEAGMSDPIKAAVTLSGAHSLGHVRSTMPHDAASGKPLFTFQANLKSHMPLAHCLPDCSLLM